MPQVPRCFVDGLGLNIHYDSSVLTFDSFSNVLSNDNIVSGSGPFDDISGTVSDVVIGGAFGGGDINGDIFTFPSGAENWAGFVNTNTDIYPFSFPDGGSLSFTGAVPSGGAVNVRFRFEWLPHPDVDPAYDTETVAVSGADEASYSISIPSQGSNTFSSLIMYVVDRDAPVTVSNLVLSSDVWAVTDGDVNTDKYISFEWESSSNDWPDSTLPETLAEITFNVNENVGADTTTIAFSSTSTNAGYAFVSTPYDMPLYSNNNQIVYVDGTPFGVQGQSVTIPVKYNAGDATLTGLGLNIHYDSSVLTFEDFSDVLVNGQYCLC